jgi:hypothetical protein
MTCIFSSHPSIYRLACVTCRFVDDDVEAKDDQAKSKNPQGGDREQDRGDEDAEDDGDHGLSGIDFMKPFRSKFMDKA